LTDFTILGGHIFVLFQRIFRCFPGAGRGADFPANRTAPSVRPGFLPVVIVVDEADAQQQSEHSP
jgi:hypothetical protein